MKTEYNYQSFTPEEVEQGLHLEFLNTLLNYNKVSKEDKQKLEDEILDIQKSLVTQEIYINISTKNEIYNDNIGTGAMAIFVGLYIGIAFVISNISSSSFRLSSLLTLL